MGMTQQFLLFCLWWPWPLTFELGRDFCTMYLTTKFDRPTFSRSKLSCGQTNKQTPLKTSSWLCYATPVGNQTIFSVISVHKNYYLSLTMLSLSRYSSLLYTAHNCSENNLIMWITLQNYYEAHQFCLILNIHEGSHQWNCSLFLATNDTDEKTRQRTLYR